MTKKIIHINHMIIQHNNKYGKNLPAFRVEESGQKPARYCMGVNIQGPIKMVYNNNNPRPCGSELWIETTSDVVLIGETRWKDIRENMKLK